VHLAKHYDKMRNILPAWNGLRRDNLVSCMVWIKNKNYENLLNFGEKNRNSCHLFMLRGLLFTATSNIPNLDKDHFHLGFQTK